MTDITTSAMPVEQSRADARTTKLLARRHAAEFRFKLYGVIAIVIAMIALAALLFTIVGKGYSAFYQHRFELEVTFSGDLIDPKGDGSAESLKKGNYQALFKNSIYATFPDVSSRKDKKKLNELFSSGAYLVLRDMAMSDPSLVGQTIKITMPLDDMVDMLLKGNINRDLPETDRPISDQQIAWVDQLEASGAISSVFNDLFFTSGASREAELAGIWAALTGSFFTMLVTFGVTFPIGVAASIYLEEFAPKNGWWATATDFIEVNINNLAAVPSIVFGLLGLAVFLGWFGMTRSSPAAGGLVLALMTLPTIIIAARASMKAVPPSIREAALGMGASRWQAVSHHVLPLAMPGIFTGTIIGMAQALGETAPLLMMGMVAFIVDPAVWFDSAATVLPVQIYQWSDMPERAFEEKTSAAIIVLLTFLIIMNLMAIMMRKKFERRW